MSDRTQQILRGSHPAVFHADWASHLLGGVPYDEDKPGFDEDEQKAVAYAQAHALTAIAMLLYQGSWRNPIAECLDQERELIRSLPKERPQRPANGKPAATPSKAQRKA